MSLTRRSFLKLLTAATALPLASDAVALITTPELVGQDGYASLPVRELLDYSIDDDAIIYRVDVRWTLPGGGEQASHVNVFIESVDLERMTREDFDAVYRAPAMVLLRNAIEHSQGFNPRAPTMPHDCYGLPEHLRA